MMCDICKAQFAKNHTEYHFVLASKELVDSYTLFSRDYSEYESTETYEYTAIDNVTGSICRKCRLLYRTGGVLIVLVMWAFILGGLFWYWAETTFEDFGNPKFAKIFWGVIFTGVGTIGFIGIPLTFFSTAKDKMTANLKKRYPDATLFTEEEWRSKQIRGMFL